MKTINDLLEKVNVQLPVHEFDEVKNLMPTPGSEYAPLRAALQQIVEQSGWSVTTSNEMGFNIRGVGNRKEVLGVSDLEKKRVWLRATNPNWETYTLAHELGHITHELLNVPLYSHQDREAWAETVAYFALSELLPDWNNTVTPAYVVNQRIGNNSLRAVAPYTRDIAAKLVREVRRKLPLLVAA